VQGWAIRIAIIAVIAIGAFVLRDRLSGGADALEVGNCFDEPVGATTITEVQHHPCSESHTSEVIFVGKMTGSDDAYPADTDIDAYAETQCLPAYKAYTGKDFETDTEMDIAWFYPTPAGWKDGDRGVSCYAIRIDGAATTTSIKLAQ
jgi:hypothetical protein